MKALIAILAVLTLSASAFADDGLKYICKQVEPSPGYGKKTFVLTQIGVQRIQEGHKAAFILEVFESGTRQPSIVSKVFVQTEDVNFIFGNRLDQISGHIFMDELNQSSITIAGEVFSMDCE